MIKKAILPRVCGLIVLYSTVFILLTMMQFTRYGGFTKRIGDIEITGQYQKDSGDKVDSLGFEQALTNRLAIMFNGVEFDLKKGIIYSNSGKTNIHTARMSISDNAVSFHLPEGVITFSTNGYQALSIRADIANLIDLEIPYKLLKTARIQNNNGQFVVISDKGSYAFDNARISPERQTLILTGDSPSVSYMRIPVNEPVAAVSGSQEDSVFDTNDFVIENGRGKSNFDKTVEQWRAKVFSLWGRTIATTSDEKQIAAYESEALSRGTYGQSRTAPSTFLNSNTRTFISSVFLGRTDLALRSITSAQRDTSNLLNQQIRDKSFDFFKEAHPIEWLSVRGYIKTVDDAGEWIMSIDPSTVFPDNVPGILEGYADWSVFRVGRDNPFSKFSTRVQSLVFAGIRKSADGQQVFVFNGGLADMEFNIRLGKALAVFAEIIGDENLANVGRSIVLSVLSLSDEGTGMIPKELLIADISADASTPSAATNGVSAAVIYEILRPSENYPRAIQLIPGAQPIWVWTAASSVTVTSTNASLDIFVSFPQGETHYMLIRGISPRFTRLQLYNMNYRTASDFERWDSSGWSYSASEQILLVKMKHRSPVEHIQIFW
ncbi:MAG: hypothetical protein LBI40_02090 [Treponema sp.]|jgi:hypothetical protein|nr:hypothetical protein [Treponema sp.]